MMRKLMLPSPVLRARAMELSALQDTAAICRAEQIKDRATVKEIHRLVLAIHLRVESESPRRRVLDALFPESDHA